MQLKRFAPVLAIALATSALAASRCAAEDAVDEESFSTLLRYFVDSNHVLVRSAVGDYAIPLQNQLGLTVHWNNERVTVPGISAPPGSQAAVDAITTASRPIEGNAFQDFVKVRNELEGELSRGAATLSYYHSAESDYLAQQVGARWNRDLRHDQLNLALGSSYGWDEIEPLADDRSTTGPASKTTLHLNAVATEILSSSTVVRVGLEVNHVQGLQHNPYRHVYAGGTNVSERAPDTRDRRDAFVKVNRYLSNRGSLRLSYRVYDDDWGVFSHEAGAQLSQYLTPGAYVSYDYRWYTQTAANFWRSEYLTTTGVDGFLTGDYRLGPLSSHLFGAELHLDMRTLAAQSKWLRRSEVTLNYERYFNSNNYSADILETGLDFHF